MIKFNVDFCCHANCNCFLRPDSSSLWLSFVILIIEIKFDCLIKCAKWIQYPHERWLVHYTLALIRTMADVLHSHFSSIRGHIYKFGFFSPLFHEKYAADSELDHYRNVCYDYDYCFIISYFAFETFKIPFVCQKLLKAKLRVSFFCARAPALMLHSHSFTWLDSFARMLYISAKSHLFPFWWFSVCVFFFLTEIYRFVTYSEQLNPRRNKKKMRDNNSYSHTIDSNKQHTNPNEWIKRKRRKKHEFFIAIFLVIKRRWRHIHSSGLVFV